MATRRTRPNVLIIHAHDLGRHSSVYGHGIDTPALQRFAGTATVFSNAWTTTPTCSPSRASLLTGRYPHETGMFGLAHLGFALERTDLHLSRRLRDEGYRTILSGVQHEVPDHRQLSYDTVVGGDPHAPYAPGFDPVQWDDGNARAVAAFLRSEEFYADGAGDRAPRSGGTVARAVPSGGAPSGTGASRDRPWFLFLGLFEPHRPFGDDDGAIDDRGVPAGLPDAPEIRREYAAFRRAVTRTDARIGTVLAALEETGLNEETVVVVTSDHGIDFPRYKCTLSPGGLGIHLLIRRPGQNGRIDTRVPVSNLDVVPTILELIGIDDRSGEVGGAGVGDAPWTARSLAPLWDAPDQPVRSHLFAEMNYHVAYDPARSVFDGRYHYVVHYETEMAVLPNIGDSTSKDLLFPDRTVGATPLSPLLIPPGRALYDLWFDPLQNTNLLNGMSAAARTPTGKAMANAQTAARTPMTATTKETAERLEDLLVQWQ
ncbi:MAG: sulfatase-like hydrolase/transferase, partial [Alkalispirochaeta sp.]